MSGVQQKGGEILDRPPWLPPGYVLDESDPDMLILRRDDGSFVVAFSARGANREGILKALEEDCGKHEQEKSGHLRRSGRRYIRPWHGQGRP